MTRGGRQGGDESGSEDSSSADLLNEEAVLGWKWDVPLWTGDFWSSQKLVGNPSAYYASPTVRHMKASVFQFFLSC